MFAKLRKYLTITNFSVFLILFVAAFLRLYKIRDYLTFLGDEGRDALVVYGILHGHLTLLGPTASVGGFFLGPIYYYFITPFLWLFRYDPVGPAIMVAIFGVITVLFVYKVGTEFFGKTAGFISAILYTLSPFIISYSRSSWNPNLMPFFSMLILYLTFKTFGKNFYKLFFVIGILLGILMQLHYLAVFVIAMVGGYMLLDRWVHHTKLLILLRKYLFVFAGFMIGFSPFLAFEVRHGYENIKNITAFILHGGGGTTLSFFITIPLVFFRIFGRLMTTFPPIELVSLDQRTILLGVLTLSIGLFSLGIFLYEYWKLLKDKDKRESIRFAEYSMIFFWFVIGMLLFGFYQKRIFDYYFALLYPAPFLLVGNAFSFFWKRTKIMQGAAFATLISLTVLSISGNTLRANPNKQLSQTENIAKFITEKADSKPFNFALITGGNSDHAYIYFFTIWNKIPVTIQDYSQDPTRSTVTEQLFVVCESLPCYPLKDYVWKIAFFGKAQIAGHWQVNPYEVYKLTHYKNDKFIKFSPTP